VSWEAPIKKEMEQVEEEIRRGVLSEESDLTDICMHVIGAGGKRLRPGVALLAYRAAGGTKVGKFIGVAASFELIHSATLVHDDINDHGEIRRGRVAAYKKFGVHRALIAGDFMFVRSFKLGGNWDRRVVQIISDACTATAESEILQGAHEFDPKLDAETYFRIVTGKTARLIEAAALVGAHMADSEAKVAKALGEYAINLGIAFQIVDDVLDLNGMEKELGKPMGVDLTDGKATLPLLYAMEDGKLGERISRIFVKRKKTRAEVERAVGLVAQTDALERSMAAAGDYSREATRRLKGVRSSRYREALSDLAGAVVDRRS
jgi:octaprenyl-diphosphate synthase